MDFVVTEFKRSILVDLGGRIDSSAAPELQHKLEALTSAGHHRLIINMADVSFISSGALRALITTLSACRKSRGDLRLSEPSVAVQRVLDLTSLNIHFKIYPSDTEAVGGF